MVNAADMNGNSQIEFDEFLLMMAKNKNYQFSDQALTDVFNNFDTVVFYSYNNNLRISFLLNFCSTNKLSIL